MKTPVTVVIPLHNKAPHILRAVESVLSQTVPEFELLVVDDASTDGGGRRLEPIQDPRLRVLRRHEASPGGHAARNAGVREARAELIAFLDADDEWRPGFLQTVLRLRERFPQAGAYATDFDILSTCGRPLPRRLEGIPDPPWEGLLPSYFRSALNASPVFSSAVAVPKTVFAAVGVFPEGEPRGGDVDMWMRIALGFPIAYSTEIGATYHMEAANRIDTAELSAAEFRLVRTALEALSAGSVPAEMRVDLREFISQFQIKSASANILLGRPEVGRRILASCETERFIGRKLWWLFWSLAPTGLPRILWDAKRRWTTGADTVLVSNEQSGWL